MRTQPVVYVLGGGSDRIEISNELGKVRIDCFSGNELRYSAMHSADEFQGAADGVKQ
ncbi:hypothetical protein R3Q06_31345 [Rhodococcus erythropolis]|uniref:hypothetical protein n=1 Tax=Rhodococcus erythropolis TaxID=1833 RepID=UPI00294A375E|nr:hypothetical protein [Rhodococcus erythropolis]MDV6277981.1 hypothetical protein [Rhodococcus erythropolis]